jgi:uncharacterized protein (DUF4415 family)
MKENYDFSQGKRGAIIPTASHQAKVNLTLDQNVIDWFKSKVNESGGGDYHQLINQVLQDYINQETRDYQNSQARINNDDYNSFNLGTIKT